MSLNPMYVKGYNAGYKKGVQSGLSGSVARTVMERDLIFIYGVMAIVLTEKHHWKQTSVEKLITEIQNQWARINAEAETKTETMADIVERRTGISLKQFTEDILIGGMDE